MKNPAEAGFARVIRRILRDRQVPIAERTRTNTAAK
jgi:hypothetical protein